MRYFIFHKPFRVLTQFSAEGDKSTLADFGFPPKVYPLGRLDYESEGLLILSDDKKLNHLLLNPQFEHKKTYWAQLEGEVTSHDLAKFKTGLEINIKGKIHKTRPAEIKPIFPEIAERNPPIRFRKNIPSPWYEISITEGKNRQIRKMTAAIGHPSLRLIRVGIEELQLGKLQAGEFIELSKKSIYGKLHISTD